MEIHSQGWMCYQERKNPRVFYCSHMTKSPHCHKTTSSSTQQPHEALWGLLGHPASILSTDTEWRIRSTGDSLAACWCLRKKKTEFTSGFVRTKGNRAKRTSITDSEVWRLRLGAFSAMGNTDLPIPKSIPSFL